MKRIIRWLADVSGVTREINEEAINIAIKYGGIDGVHHKEWVIDQMVRKLSGSNYEQIVKDACDGETYDWSTGIAP